MRSNLKMASSEGNVGYGCGGHFFAQFELDSALLDRHDAPAADDVTGCNVKFLSYASA